MQRSTTLGKRLYFHGYTPYWKGIERYKEGPYFLNFLEIWPFLIPFHTFPITYQNMPMYNVRLGEYFFLLCHTVKIQLRSKDKALTKAVGLQKNIICSSKTPKVCRPVGALFWLNWCLLSQLCTIHHRDFYDSKS